MQVNCIGANNVYIPSFDTIAKNYNLQFIVTLHLDRRTVADLNFKQKDHLAPRENNMTGKLKSHFALQTLCRAGQNVVPIIII